VRKGTKTDVSRLQQYRWSFYGFLVEFWVD